MATPIHSEQSPVTLNDVSEVCSDMIDVFEEARMVFSIPKLITSLKSMSKDGHFTHSSLAAAMISLFEVWEETTDFLPHFVKLGEKDPQTAWYTAQEMNLALEHLLDSEEV